MHLPLRIRSGRPEDDRLLSVLATQVWLHTYATEGIDETIARYVLSELTAEKYRRLLGDPATRVLVAERGGSLVGFCVVKFGVKCPATGARSAAELQTLYVQEHFIGQGIGARLLDSAEATSREQAEPALWLAVYARNRRAIDFYAHRGYTRVGTSYFILGDERHENHVLIGDNA